MGARAFVGLPIGVAIVVVLVAVTRCLPEPGGGIEWVQRADAVVVQMKVSGGFDVTGRGDFITAEVPDITLYGDGTLLVKDEENPVRLIKTKLSSGTIRDLLEFTKGQGFFNFEYQQPNPGVLDPSPTFVYVSTKLTANAVTAPALGMTLPAGDEWKQLRGPNKVYSRIQSVADEARTSFTARDYSYDAIVLGVQKISRNASLPGPSPKEWPFPDVDLTAMVGGGIFAERQFSGEQARQIVDTLEKDSLFSQNDRFLLFYRPVLPYEENFPEFEPAP